MQRPTGQGTRDSRQGEGPKKCTSLQLEAGLKRYMVGEVNVDSRVWSRYIGR